MTPSISDQSLNVKTFLAGGCISVWGRVFVRLGLDCQIQTQDRRIWQSGASKMKHFTLYVYFSPKQKCTLAGLPRNRLGRHEKGES